MLFRLLTLFFLYNLYLEDNTKFDGIDNMVLDCERPKTQGKFTRSHRY